MWSTILRSNKIILLEKIQRTEKILKNLISMERNKCDSIEKENTIEWESILKFFKKRVRANF